MPHLKRAADSLASSTGATAASPVPTPSIDPTFAPGKRGPAGVSPRQNYSRVNTGAPPQMDAGASEQKSMAPRGAEMLPKRASAGEEIMGKLAARPMLQDLVKEAMITSGDRVRISEEARLQQEKTAEEKCGECGMEKHSGACKTKKASAALTAKLSGVDVEKLASACDACAEILKEAASLAGPHNLTEHLQTSPPGVSQATASKTLPDHKGQGVRTVPMHPGEQKALPAEHGGTQMENNLAHPVGGSMIERNYGKKHAGAGVLTLIRTKLASTEEQEKKETKGLEEAKKGLETAESAHKSEPENKGKEAAAPVSLVDYLQSRVKQAEDAINPAQISAGAAVAPETSAAGESGGAPAGGAPQGPTGLVGSSEAARDYTKGEAYANRKNDLKQYFQEPALSAEHDKVLQVAFDNTSKAGTKFASAGGAPETATPAGAPAAASVKTAAARVLLTKLAANIDEKQSAGTSTPAAAAGRV